MQIFFYDKNRVIGLKSRKSPFAEFQEVIGSANGRRNDLPNRAEIKICYVIALSLNMLIFTGTKFKPGIRRLQTNLSRIILGHFQPIVQPLSLSDHFYIGNRYSMVFSFKKGESIKRFTVILVLLD